MADTNQAWLWVIEYCASVEEIDSETLHASINAASRFAKELGKMTMEVVALKCLEDLFTTSDKCMDEGCFGPAEKISSSDLSNVGKEILKWDIQPLIMHKRASISKCALKQLKDAILEGIHPCIATLKEHSGLVRRDDVDHPFVCDVVAFGIDNTTVQNMISTENLFPVPHENDEALGDGSHDGNLLPCNRDGIVLANEMEDHHENDDANNLNSEAKKLKEDCLFTEQPKDHILNGCVINPRCEEKLVEDDSERMAQDNEKDDLSVEIEPQLGQLEESRSIDNGHSDSAIIAGIGQSRGAGDVSGHNLCETEINTNIVEPISGGPPQQECNARTEQDSFTDEAKKISDLRNLLKSSPVASLDGFHGKVNLEEPESKSEGKKDHLSKDDTSRDGEEYNHRKVDTSDEEDNLERVDTLQKKYQFLNSQCPGVDDSFSMFNWTEQNLCGRCKKSGQLLVCTLPGCPLVIHEKCLGAPAEFDDKGDFYCPFCRYSLAFSRYVEGKKRTSLARKQLASMFRDCAVSAGKKDHHFPSCRTKENVGKRKRRAHKIQKKKVKAWITKENSRISNYSMRVQKRENQ